MIRTSTPTPGKRQTRRVSRTGEILDHAMAIVIADGLDGLTMPRLAEESEAAVGALYRYFPGKEAVVAELQVRAVAALGDFLAARGDEGPLERIVGAGLGWVAFDEAHPALFALVDRALAAPQPVLSDDEARRVEDAVRAVLRPVVAAFEEGVAAGVFAPGDPELRARALWAAVHGAAQFRKRDRILPPAQHAAAVRAELLRALLVGWGAEPGRVTALVG